MTYGYLDNVIITAMVTTIGTLMKFLLGLSKQITPSLIFNNISVPKVIISFCKLHKVLHGFLHMWNNFRLVSKASVSYGMTKHGNFCT